MHYESWSHWVVFMGKLGERELKLATGKGQKITANL